MKIGFWAKAAGNIDVTMQIRDPGVEVRQSRFYDTWDVGPVTIEAGDWHYVEIPMPAFGRAFAQRNPHREANGIVDYPLTLIQLQFNSEVETQVMIDDIACQSQGEKEGSLFVRRFRRNQPACSIAMIRSTLRSPTHGCGESRWMWISPRRFRISTAKNGPSSLEKLRSRAGR